MDDIGSKLSAIVASIIGLAVLAVIVSQGANTANVLQAFFGGVTNLIGVAISPVTGQSINSGTGLTGGAWQAGGIGGGYSGFASSTSGSGGLFGGGGGLLGSLLGSTGSSLSGAGGSFGNIFGGDAGGIGSGITPTDNSFNTGGFDASAANLDTIF